MAKLTQDELIELDARRQRIIAEQTRPVVTKTGETIVAVNTAHINDAYGPYLLALYQRISELEAELKAIESISGNGSYEDGAIGMNSNLHDIFNISKKALE